ncbi:NAD-dependent epimerase/dehydratase family protein [Intrasporangium calvum]|uniref:NAD-dependent epimerase/dehydratase family protein n=1 Tax=Intrasporangium calvum TaxID=53358 RepID=A0ABT5GJJ8_9MICO|nr:NAD-dependent epimerase/dehydratase family protein [Intrasporangium calvum]MDC5698171.1 NAD-dependent epimerase/dehydratase family protein [Intrasporangium calvum]
MVTGGTGFVGSHIVTAILAAGHEVRLLVRRPEQVGITFAPHGVVPTDLVVGDVRDADVVARALEGCDAVVHAAAIFSLRPRNAPIVAETNTTATRVVLDAAVAAGADPVIHISSTIALIRRGGSGPDLPIGDLTGVYARSKIDSEVIARGHQVSGAPVVSIYPGGVYGPLDPYLSENNNRLAWVARGLFPIWTKGGLHMVDVRDVAGLVQYCLEPGRGPRRYVVPGHQATGRDTNAAVAAAIGRHRPHVDLGERLTLLMAKPLESLDPVTSKRWHFPAEVDGIQAIARDTRLDDTPARKEFGLEPRPFEETIRDTLTWLVEAGHLPGRLRPRPVEGTLSRPGGR